LDPQSHSSWSFSASPSSGSQAVESPHIFTTQKVKDGTRDFLCWISCQSSRRRQWKSCKGMLVCKLEVKLIKHPQILETYQKRKIRKGR